MNSLGDRSLSSCNNKMQEGRHSRVRNNGSVKASSWVERTAIAPVRWDSLRWPNIIINNSHLSTAIPILTLETFHRSSRMAWESILQLSSLLAALKSCLKIKTGSILLLSKWIRKRQTNKTQKELIMGSSWLILRNKTQETTLCIQGHCKRALNLIC